MRLEPADIKSSAFLLLFLVQFKQNAYIFIYSFVNASNGLSCCNDITCDHLECINLIDFQNDSSNQFLQVALR